MADHKLTRLGKTLCADLAQRGGDFLFVKLRDKARAVRSERAQTVHERPAGEDKLRPSAIARTTSIPLRMPLSNITVDFVPTALAMAGRQSIAGGAASS